MSTATDMEIPAEVRGYIARLQETIRDMEGKLYALEALLRAGLDTIDKATAHSDVATPEGIHNLNEPRRVDHDEDGRRWSEWLVSCSCGWEDGEYERHGHAEMLGRMHAGYYNAADFSADERLLG